LISGAVPVCSDVGVRFSSAHSMTIKREGVVVGDGKKWARVYE
jgi:hypothetical protein